MDTPKPPWIKVRMKQQNELEQVRNIMSRLSLHTICEEGNCPNLFECFGQRTATFMILGRFCTRNCTFCNVAKEKPLPIDIGEARQVALAAKELKLRHVVVTSVTRDDLADGGAGQFAETISALRAVGAEITIEVLIPDFQGSLSALTSVAAAAPEIINHNLETVPRLYPEVRPMAQYRRSLDLLRRVKELNGGILSKSGIMLGLGEQEEEVLSVLNDLRWAGCDLLTIGQYLAPSRQHHPVIEYVAPEKFAYYEAVAVSMGFRSAFAGPLVRSSYHAHMSVAKK